MAGTLEGRAALVTGGGFGLGRASALAFSREGARVVVADIDVENGRQTVAMIDKAGGEALFIRTDVSRATDVEAMVNQAVDTFGRLDCAHNNAGFEEMPGPFTEATEEEWYRVMDVNLKGVWLCLKYEIKYMVEHGGGAIVNTSSIAGLTGSCGPAIYTASKHGIIGLTRSTAVQYARQGIRVNAVCPAGMRGTGMYQRVAEIDPELPPRIAEMVPLGRDSDPTEVAEAVVWLCSDAASYITGHPLAVDGGYVTR